MAEENTSANPQAGAATQIHPQPQAGATPQTDPQAGESQDDEIIDLKKAKDLRSEAINLRKRLKDSETTLAELKAFKEQIEASQLSETDKRDRAAQQREKQIADALKERDNLAQELRNTKANTAIQILAVQQGIDPKLASRLFDQSALDFDESGNPTNAVEVFKAMVKEFGLSGKAAQSPSTGGGATQPARSQSADNGEITASYVADVMSGKIAWQSLTQDRRTAVLNWQANNRYKF